jgi:cytochrome c oxidase subunit 2
MIRKLGAAMTWAGLAVGSALTVLLLNMGAASAAEATGGSQPVPWQITFQTPADARMRAIVDFHNVLLWVVTAITLFVLALLCIIMVKFNSKANPVPSATTHNTLLEVLWTIVPVLILVGIAIPSFRLLYYEDTIPKADLTIKAIGRQWYWSYEYPDNGNFAFDSQMLNDADAKKAGEPRLLGTDNHVVLPVNKTIRVLVTGADVIHSWAVPAFGVKIDAEPGRINQTWFKAEKEGIYYGECSELCGARHAFMPIEVEIVSQEKYDAWVAAAKKKFASDDASVTRVAAR